MRAWIRRFKWQDWALMVGGFVFAPSLVVSIIDEVDMPLATSLPTALVLTVFIVCYASLRLWLAASSTILTAACWYFLVFG